MRLNKSDPTGNYWYLNDGFSPASDVLSDGYSTFTPGISETKGAAGGGYASEFYLADASGNSRGLLNGSGTATDGYNWDAFGNLVSRFGSNPTGFAWNEKSGYQTDNDDGLTLLGHRYYDKRTGRFISQDPAGDGDNWYQYADNDPMNETDPTGLFTPPYHNLGMGDVADGTGQMSFGAPNDSWVTDGLELDTIQRKRSGTVTSTVDADGHITHDTVWGPWGPWIVIDRTPLVGISAGDFNPFNFDDIPNPLLHKFVNDQLRLFKEDLLRGLLGSPSALTPNQMNQQIKKGQAPKGIDRIDIGKTKGEQTHAHFDDDSALNMDGTWKHGGRTLTGDQSQYLAANGWTLP